VEPTVRRLDTDVVGELLFRTAVIEARRCAMVVLESATYVRGKLANVPVGSALREHTLEVCEALVRAGYDVIDQVPEACELGAAGWSTSAIRACVIRVVDWLSESLYTPLADGARIGACGPDLPIRAVLSPR
jgi:hypothetical protein